MPTPEEVIAMLELEEHPEGGFFKETWRADETVAGDCLPARYRTGRSHGTAIYYLITPDSFSTLHRITSDEIFHFYLGDPVAMFHLSPDGQASTPVLGPDLALGHRPQVTVPRHWWQGARLVPGGSFALMGTTVAPGFDFADFELGRREDLLRDHPGHADMIMALTRA